MANFCLMPAAVEKFKAALKDGTVNPARLANMTSEERAKIFEGLVGKPNAQDVNSLFESKLLLKNQQKGMISWAKSVAGMNETVKRDLLDKISRMDRVLDPESKQAFLKDLASTKLGVGVTHDEAKTIAEMSRKVETARAAMQDGGDRMAFGRAKVALSNYVSDLKVQAQKIDYKTAPGTAAMKTIGRIPGEAKAINASMDNSAIFRQGWKTLWTQPGIWAKNAKASFGNLVKQFGGKEVMDEIQADIVSRATYDKMVRAKLAVGTLEEAFPTTTPEKIPLLGRAYKASEAAYTAFVQKTRADVFDKYLEIAQKSGVDIENTKELESIGKLVNSLTGRGSLGKAEPVGNLVNNVFFSPRFLKSNIDMVTHAVGVDVAGSKLTPFARKQAAMNLMKIVAGTAGVITIANAVKPGSVELDPRSSDFGKIKTGHTRFDVTGGVASIMTLASRLATMSSKSTTTGQVNKLNSGKVGSQTGLDVLNDFIDNKVSPAAGVVRDLLKGENPSGEKPTPFNEAKNLFTPIGVQNYEQMSKDPQSANKLLTAIIDGLGIASNTYGPTNPNKGWETSDSKELQQFKAKVGATRFKDASQQYSDQLTKFMDDIVNNNDYKNLSTADQKQVITNQKNKIQKDIFQKNGFRYRQDRGASTQLKKFLR